MSKYPTPSPLFDTLEQFKNDPLKAEKKPVFARYDFESAFNFLVQYEANKSTFESYRREIERLLQWSWLIEEKSILELTRQDMEQYIAFCLNPPKSWVALKRVPRFYNQQGRRLPNPTWRPFVVTVSKGDHKKGISPDKNHYHLSQKAIQEIFTVLSSFYNYLLLEEKAPANPIALIRQKSKYLQKRQKQASVMRLTSKQWQVCLETAKDMAETMPERHERTLFMLSILYLLYLRISELVASERWSPQMGHFYQDSNQRWWFKTVGKGNKMRDIAVSDDMLISLKRYRESLQLPPLPYPNESTPLLCKEKGQGTMKSSRHIRRLVQVCFDKAIEKLRQRNLLLDADTLEAATVHWLRHTGISDDINQRGRPVAHVRDDAGHSSIATTDRYNDIELIARHQSAKSKKLKKDET